MEASSFIAHNLDDTIKLAQKIASQARHNDIFTVSGPMGAGKSEFARAFIRHLMNDKNLDVPSPTFTIVQTYETPQFAIWHFDLYRLKDADEIYEIGWEEAISNGVLLIEWPERLEELLPKSRIDIVIKPLNDESRTITITPYKNGRP